MIGRFTSVCLSIFMLMFLLTGCDASQAELETEKRQAAEHADALRHATNTGHQTPEGMRQECLGRHVFDVRSDFEWGVPPLSFSNEKGWHTGFGELLFPRWGMRVDGVRLGVASSGTMKQVNERVESMLDTEHIILHDDERELKGDQLLLARWEALKDVDDPVALEQQIKKIRIEIADLEERIALEKKSLGKDTLDLDLPDSAGYGIAAFLLREGRLYSFINSPKSGRPDPFTRADGKALFLTWLKRFRPRALFEIPDEPGICFPYGFIADEGTFEHDLKVSFRYADAPGVFYHLRSNTAGEYGAEPVFMETASRALAAKLDYRAAAAHSRSIGPRKVMMGALPAEQGGFELNYPAEDNRPLTTYSLFTGRNGVRGSMALPDLSVEMESYVPEQSPEVTTDPPPLDESMKRLDALLTGFRLRPTEPPLPELRQAQE